MNNYPATSQNQSLSKTQQNTTQPETVANNDPASRTALNNLRTEFSGGDALTETAVQLWVAAAEAAMKRQERMTISLLLKLLEKRPQPLPPLLAVYQHYCQGALAYIENNWEQAGICLNRALEELAKFHPLQDPIKPDSKYSELEANLLITLARALGDSGQLEAAQKIIQKVLSFAKAAQLASVESKALNVLSFIAWFENNFQAMLDYAHLALDCAQKSDDDASKVRAFQFIGIGYAEQGLYEEAIKAYEQAIQICQLTGQSAKLAPICINLALIYARLDKNEEALITFKMALNLSKQRSDKIAVAIILHHIGDIHQKLNQPEEAVETYRQAWQMSEQMDNLNCKLLAASSLARSLAESGETAEAQAYTTQTRELLEMPDTPVKVVAYYLVVSYANFVEALLRLSTTEQEIEEVRSYRAQYEALCRKNGDLKPVTDLDNKLVAVLRDRHKFADSAPALAILNKS